MVDQGYDLTFHSKGCEIRKEGSGRLMENEIRSPKNVYVLNQIKGKKK